MFADNVTTSPVNTVPLGARLTVTVGVLRTTATDTVSVPVSPAPGPPLVAVSSNVAV
jgi:hypothetical protein